MASAIMRLPLPKNCGRNSNATLCSPLSKLLQRKMPAALMLYRLIAYSTDRPENMTTRYCIM